MKTNLNCPQIFPPTNFANFNGQKPTIEADDAVMLLIDHQSSKVT
jgi:hypothetical protein